MPGDGRADAAVQPLWQRWQACCISLLTCLSMTLDYRKLLFLLTSQDASCAAVTVRSRRCYTALNAHRSSKQAGIRQEHNLLQKCRWTVRWQARIGLWKPAACSVAPAIVPVPPVVVVPAGSQPEAGKGGRGASERATSSKEHAAGTWSIGPPEAGAAKQTELRERRCMHPGQGLHVGGLPAAGGTWPKRTCHRRRRSRGRSRCKPRGQANGQPGRRVNSQQRG